jgi:hypothetical protein
LTAYVKPRVERQVPFVRDSFWTGRSFESLEQINVDAERWCLTVAGERRHGTTRTEPLLLFRTLELPAMLPLPATPFEVVTWARAKVARDCHVQVEGSLYSIPWRYVGQTLDVRLGATIVRFYAGYGTVDDGMPRLPACIAHVQRAGPRVAVVDEQRLFPVPVFEIADVLIGAEAANARRPSRLGRVPVTHLQQNGIRS